MNILTKWVVITGAPSSGKTSVIKTLEAKGHTVAHEVARAYILKLMHKHVDVTQLRSDISLQNKILSLKKARERHLVPDQQIFFDRGIPDSLAYYKLHGLPTAGLFQDLYRCRYKKVFFLEQLPLVRDEVRNESESVAHRLNDLIFESYVECDYEPITVPVMSIADREQFILEHCLAS